MEARDVAIRNAGPLTSQAAQAPDGGAMPAHACPGPLHLAWEGTLNVARRAVLPSACALIPLARVSQFTDVRLFHELHHAGSITMLVQAPPDYCVAGAGLDAKATTSVNDCYITADDVSKVTAFAHVSAQPWQDRASADLWQTFAELGARAVVRAAVLLSRRFLGMRCLLSALVQTGHVLGRLLCGARRLVVLHLFLTADTGNSDD